MRPLPTGTVTFLFTDVESSTKLVHRLGERYHGVLADHRRLLREAVAERRGHEIDCRGDEFFFAFETPGDAVAAAVDAQRSLAAHGWPDGAPVRVRMGIHTGEALLVEDDYVGLEVHRAARVSSAAHGGQVLISAESREAIQNGSRPDVGFDDLGEHPLRGLPEPHRLYQLVAPGLRSDFPPLRSGENGVSTIAQTAVASPLSAPTHNSGTPVKQAVRVVVAEDSVLLREGVVRLLEETGFDVVGQSGTAEDLMLKVRSYSPDVAVVDIRMPPTHTDEGLRAAREIREQHPDVGVLVLSQYVEPAYALELLSDSAEGVGYLLKDRVSDVEEFTAAVRRVADGGSALDPAIVSQLVGRQRREDPLDELTPREREVLELMAEGRSNQGIAERLVVTERAVEKHVTSIFNKLRLSATSDDHRRVLAVLALLRS